MVNASRLESHHPSVSDTPTHCVFRRGRAWLALPATEIREVLPRPQMVAVPRTPATFVGLCHVRSEFLPVLNLGTILADKRRSAEEILLIIEDTDGCWGVLVDEVATLRVLEVSDAPEAHDMSTVSAIIGWATQGETVIQVLDAARIRELAEQELAAIWEDTDEVAEKRGFPAATT